MASSPRPLPSTISIAAYLAILAEELVASRAVVHAGIEAALDAAVIAGAAVGLGTGNVRAGARLKLARVGLHERFAFGGFGCDHEARDALLRVGAERGASALGAPLDACRVVVVGDTPKDVAAARAIGAECLAVATGSFSTDALAACGATWAFRDSGPGERARRAPRPGLNHRADGGRSRRAGGKSRRAGGKSRRAGGKSRRAGGRYEESRARCGGGRYSSSRLWIGPSDGAASARPPSPSDAALNVPRLARGASGRAAPRSPPITPISWSASASFAS